MALRLRRGTDAERLTITPVEGELIYTTDLQELWIGNGITEGGNKVSGVIPQNLSDLNDVDSASPEIGQVLKWNGERWEPSDDKDSGVVEDASYKINILGPVENTIVNSDTATFTGNFVGDGSGLTNLPIATDGSGVVEGSNYRINIVDDSSTVMLNTSTSTFTGNFVGDGSGLTNLPNNTIQSIFDLNDVFRFENQTPDAGDTLIYDGFNFVSQKIRQIEGADSTIIVDTNTNTFTGNFVGDMSGSVFSDDSSLIVDSINHRLLTNKLTIDNNTISSDDEITPIILLNSSRTPVLTRSITDGQLGGFPYVEFQSQKGTIDNPIAISPGDIVGGWKITGRTDLFSDEGKITALAIGAFESDAVMSDEFPKANFGILVSAGDTSFNVFNFGSIGNFESPGPITPGVYTDATARDIAITSPIAGMTVFNTALQKFQGYVDDTGIASGGASNATPGWINLN
jgi:hypothetical protein